MATAETPKTTNESAKYVREILLSSFCIAVLSGVCYVTGYLVTIRAADDLGLSHRLLPTMSTEHVVLTGALHLVTFLAYCLLAFALFAVLDKLMHKKLTEQMNSFIRGKFWGHPFFYSLLCCALLLGALSFYTSYVPLKQLGRYSDDQFAEVDDFRLTNADVCFNAKGMRFVCKHDGWVVLKHSGIKSFVIFKDAEVAMISFKPGK